MKTIHKYPLSILDYQTIEIPEGSRLLCVQTQNGEPQLWAKVDTSKPMEELTLMLFGNGQRFTENPGDYIDTFKMAGDALVFHVFVRQ